jgi:hypothetical protein
MLKRVALLGAIAALSIAGPSHSVAQEWGGWGGGVGGVTVHVGFPAFPRRDFCCRPRIPRPPIDCCRVFQRPIDCCRVIQRPIACCRPFPRRVECCDSPYYPYRPIYRQWSRPLYYYGDRFAPYGYHYDAAYPDGGDGYGYADAGYGGYDEAQ